MTDRPQGGMVERRSGVGATMAGPILPAVSTGTTTPDRGGAG